MSAVEFIREMCQNAAIALVAVALIRHKKRH